MVRLLLACSLLAACTVSGAHFHGTELPDGPRSDTLIDGPAAMPLTHGYLIDAMAGITLMAKNPMTGALTGISQLMTSAPLPFNGAVVSKSGTHIFLFSGDTAASSMVTTLSIGSDGRTTDAGSMPLTMCPQPLYPHLDASGKYILVSCVGGAFQELKVAADDTLNIGTSLTLGGNIQMRFTLGGSGTSSCGFALDDSIAPSKLVTFGLEPMTGALSNGQSVGLQQPPSDVVATPDGSHVYAVGASNNALIFEYDVGANCSLNQKATMASLQNPPTKAAIDPTGKYVHVATNQPNSFAVNPDGTLTSLGAGNGAYPTGVKDFTFDPQFPAMAYVTEAASVVASPINGNGVLQGGMVYPGNGQNAVGFVLAP